jgi:hypothetical protein
VTLHPAIQKLITPSLWGHRRERVIAWAALVGATLGGLLSWWFSHPPQPWIEFAALSAIYASGSPSIAVSGHYQVHNDCVESGGGPVIWRIVTETKDGQIALYGPQLAPPIIVEGTHEYSALLALENGMSPNGWRVTIIATCPGLVPETVASRSVLVEIIDPILP